MGVRMRPRRKIARLYVAAGELPKLIEAFGVAGMACSKDENGWGISSGRVRATLEFGGWRSLSPRSASFSKILRWISDSVQSLGFEFVSSASPSRSAQGAGGKTD